MPIAKVRFPDGRIGRFEVPEGTTPEQVMEFVKTNPATFGAEQEQPKRPQGEPGLIGRAIRAAIPAVAGATSGVKEVKDAPELNQPNLAGLKTALGMLVSTRDAQAKDIIRANFGGIAQIEESEGGTTWVNLPSGRYMLNRPGVSGQDLNRVMAQAIPFAAGAGAGGALGQKVVGNLLGRAAGAGAGAATAQAGLDVAAGAAGSEQGIDPAGVGLAGALGTAGELAAPLVSNIWRRLFPGKAPTLQQAKDTLVDLGYPPAQVTDDFVRQFMRRAGATSEKGAAAAVAEAESLPVPLRLTRGQATGDLGEQLAEDIARKGQFGEAARLRMTGVDAEQQAALRENIPAIQERLGGGTQRVLEQGQGGRAAQRELGELAAQEKAAVGAQYDQARKGLVAVAKEERRELTNRAAESLKDFLTVSPEAQAALQRLETVGPNFRKLESWRSTVSKAAREAKDPQTAAQLKRLVGEFDGFVDDAIDKSLLRGEPEAAEAWIKARRARAEYGKKWQSGDLLEKLTAKGYRGGEVQLKIAPEDATRYIFGASDSGLLPKANLARDLRRMKELMGPQSEGWQALKEEAFLRIARSAEGGVSAQGRGLSGQKVTKALEDALSRNGEVMRTLFSAEEIAMLKQFASAARKVTTAARGTSNTAIQNNLMSLLGKMSFLSGKGQALLRSIPGGEAVGALRVSGEALKPRQLPAGVVGGAAATLGTGAGNGR